MMERIKDRVAVTGEKVPREIDALDREIGIMSGKNIKQNKTDGDALARSITVGRREFPEK